MSEMQEEKEMRVKKRDGTFQIIAFDKILNRVKIWGKWRQLLRSTIHP